MTRLFLVYYSRHFSAPEETWQTPADPGEQQTLAEADKHRDIQTRPEIISITIGNILAHKLVLGDEY